MLVDVFGADHPRQQSVQMLLMFVVGSVTVNASFVTTVCRLLCSGWAGYESHGDFDLNIFVTEITRFFSLFSSHSIYSTPIHSIDVFIRG